METTIDSAGRLVIPREIRRAAGLEAGTRVEIRYQDGVVEIQPATLPVELVRMGTLLVARPLVPVEPLTDEMVEEALEAMRQERSP